MRAVYICNVQQARGVHVDDGNFVWIIVVWEIWSIGWLF